MDDSIQIDIETNRQIDLGNYGTKETVKNFNWIAAIDAWDYCDSQPLEQMVLRHPIPEELRLIIASIISGKRKQNKKAASKLKVAAFQRMVLAATMLSLRQIPESALGNRLLPNQSEVADAKGIEIYELREDYCRILREIDIEMAEILGVSIYTAENLMVDLKNKIKNYPNI